MAFFLCKVVLHFTVSAAMHVTHSMLYQNRNIHYMVHTFLSYGDQTLKGDEGGGKEEEEKDDDDDDDDDDDIKMIKTIGTMKGTDYNMNGDSFVILFVQKMKIRKKQHGSGLVFICLF